jgi:putative drug exporter of the RND superfamily
MERWTRFVLRHRFAVVGVWAVALVAGTVLWLDLGRLLSNEFSTPGTDSEAAREILEREFGQRDDGTFLVVFKLERPADPSLRREPGRFRARPCSPCSRPATTSSSPRSRRRSS